ncbi:MAG: M48 family metalloprotease, partial [Cyanobacteria bacterium J06648_16]
MLAIDVADFMADNTSELSLIVGKRHKARCDIHIPPHSERADELTYTFQVIQDSQINAFATMGGYVYVTTGLMAFADNEAQLA